MRLSKTLKQAIKEKLGTHPEDYVWQAGFREAIDFLDEHEADIQLEKELGDAGPAANEPLVTSTGPENSQKVMETLLGQLSQLTKAERPLPTGATPSLTIPDIPATVSSEDLLDVKEDEPVMEQPEPSNAPEEKASEERGTEELTPQSVKDKFNQVEQQARQKTEGWEDEDEEPDPDA